MNYNETNEDLNILKIFLKNKIPLYIKKENTENLDLMDYYEEIFNYAGAIIDGKKINLNFNSYGTGESFIFNPKYKDFLINITKIGDSQLKIHCYLTLITLEIIKKHSKD